MSEKLLYSMGEIAELFDVKPSLIRFWEGEFSVLRPQRNKKGNRLFTSADVEHLKVIYHLVKERGMTLEGAKKAMRQERADKGVGRDAELMERLQHIRSLLVEVREDLKVGAEDILADSEVGAEDAEVSAVSVVSTGGAVSAGTAAADATAELAGTAGNTTPQTPEAGEVAPKRRAKTKSVVKITEEGDAAQTLEAGGAESTKQPAVRRPRRKKEDAENKELFAFYEQSLF